MNRFIWYLVLRCEDLRWVRRNDVLSCSGDDTYPDLQFTLSSILLAYNSYRNRVRAWDVYLKTKREREHESSTRGKTCREDGTDWHRQRPETDSRHDLSSLPFGYHRWPRSWIRQSLTQEEGSGCQFAISKSRRRSENNWLRIFNQPLPREESWRRPPSQNLLTNTWKGILRQMGWSGREGKFELALFTYSWLTIS